MLDFIRAAPGFMGRAGSLTATSTAPPEMERREDIPRDPRIRQRLFDLGLTTNDDVPEYRRLSSYCLRKSRIA